MAQYVLDYVSPPTSPTAMRGAGVAGVVRYLSGGRSKDITAAEKVALDDAHLDIALVWETTGDMTSRGAAGGAADGVAAVAEARRCGFTDDSQPIFYAVDHDVVTNTEMDTIAAYLNAAERVGRPSEVYGEFDVVEAMFARGESPKPWQAVAWSHGKRSSHAVLFQRLDHAGLAVPGNYDVNDILAADWNQTHRPAAPPASHPKEPTDVFNVINDGTNQFVQYGIWKMHILDGNDLPKWQFIAVGSGGRVDNDPNAWLCGQLRTVTNLDQVAAGLDTNAIIDAIHALPAETVAALKAAL